MSEISEEDINRKSALNLSIKLKQSSDSSNSSRNEDELFFSTNCLLMKTNLISKTAQPHPNKRQKIYDSMDLDIKKKLFSSEIAQKSDNKRSTEAISTEPTSLRVKNYKSPKKRFSIIKLIEKGKKKKKENNLFLIKKKEKESINDKKERTDIYGNVICKKNKKNVKVSFVDKVTSQSLVNIVNIESFKNYNYIYGIPKEEQLEKTSNCQCCIIY
jgi:hypothetical protein